MHLVKAGNAQIPALGLGTFGIENQLCSSIVTRALEIGYRHLDTAAMYGNEAAIGEGLRRAGVPRDDIFVTTKVWYTDLSAPDLETSARASLGRLGLDAVDLLLVHWPNPAIPMAETIGALNRMQERGLTRHIGVSNFTRPLLEEAMAASDAPLACNQIEYHPQLDQSAMHMMLQDRGMALVSYCPLGRGGALSSAAVGKAAHTHGRTPGQVVLRWQVQQAGVAAIPRTSNLARLEENFDIFDFELSADEMAEISALSVDNYRICDYGFSPEWDPASSRA